MAPAGGFKVRNGIHDGSASCAIPPRQRPIGRVTSRSTACTAYPLTYYQNKVEALSCDDECLVEAHPTGLWLNVGTAVAAEVVVDLAEDLANEKFECP